MELGQRIKQARLEAGLSQRQLCGDTITRNMLSLIENGSARPSMDTLRYLAGQLGKPMGYFLEEDGALSLNAAVMAKARQAAPEQCLALLADYKVPDGDFDAERYLLEVMACFALAEQAIQDGKPGLAGHLLVRARDAGENTPYYTEEFERRRLLLLGRTGLEDAVVLTALLPDSAEELCLRARAALAQEDLPKAQALLTATDKKDSQWHFLQAEVLFAQRQYAQAAEHYEHSDDGRKVYARLEACYRELGNFERAYYYACKQR